MSDIESTFEDKTSVVEGRCLCGSVNFRLQGKNSLTAAICHCSRCRKMTGAAYVHFTAFQHGRFLDFNGQEHVTHFPGNKGTPEYQANPIRATFFCSHCGSTVPAPRDELQEYIGICSGLLLTMSPQVDAFHFYTRSKSPWVQIPETEQQSLTVKEGFPDPDQPDFDRYSEPNRVTGSCLCGAVSFIASEPHLMMNCHCTRCRLSRAAAHATNLFVSNKHFAWRTGEDRVIRYKLLEAERFGTAFCGGCGSLVPRTSEDPAGWVCIPAGCLDSDPGLVPQGHIFVGSKAPWFDFFDDLPQWIDTP
jgi:hypothetical protein